MAGFVSENTIPRRRVETIAAPDPS